MESEQKFEFINNNQKQIKLTNGNGIELITNTNNGSIITKQQEENNITINNDKIKLPYAFIVDNGGFINLLETHVRFFNERTNVKQIILCSSFNHKINDFYDKLYLPNNSFKKLTYKWDLNPNFTNEWYEKIKKNMGEVYKSELDLIRDESEIKEENKSVIKSFRLEGEFLSRVSNRLFQIDKNWSDYLRGLIEKDLND